MVSSQSAAAPAKAGRLADGTDVTEAIAGTAPAV